MNYPRYSLPFRVIAGLVCDALLGRHRCFTDDARACMRRLSPAVELRGESHIPEGGGYVITPNHYYRPGFSSHWSALAISARIPNVHWVMTGELTFPGQPIIAPLGMPVTRFALGRAAAAYGFSAMPPMPPRPRDAAARAAAVRHVLRYAATSREAIIGLAPEGGDQPGGQLSIPPAGAGRFCLLLAAAGLRFLPVGVYEQDGRLVLHFGEPYALQIPHACTPDEKDREAAFSVMNHIAPLLPASLRGAFGSGEPSPAVGYNSAEEAEPPRTGAR